MRGRLVIILVLALLLAGCRQAAVDQARLVALDSLIAVSPDSAAALLEAYPDDSLRTAGDRAYRALLLTQARYKAYIPATGDSLISMAVEHYADGHDPDKRTRSLLYKGCVMTELGQTDSATYWFKRAEAAASRDDHATLGYINLRLADLLANELIYDTCCINYYEKSLNHYRFLPPSDYQVAAALGLSSISGIRDRARAKEYLILADSLAKRLGNDDYTAQYLAQAASLAMRDSSYHQALDYASRAIGMGDHSVRTFTSAVVCLSALGQTDSARRILGRMPSPTDRVDSMNRHRALAEYARATNDLDAYVFHDNAAGNLSDTIFLEAKQNEIKEIENKYANAMLRLQLEKSRFRLWLVVALMLLAALSLAMIAARLKHQVRKRLVAEERLEQTISQLRAMKEAYSIKDEQIGRISGEMAQKENENQQMRESVRISRNAMQCLDEIIDRLYDLKQSKKRKSLALSSRFWEDLEAYIDHSFNNILADENQLSIKQRRLLGLCCLGIPLEVSALALDLTVKTLYNYRPAIARVISAGQTSSLEDAIDKFRGQNDTPSPQQDS